MIIVDLLLVDRIEDFNTVVLNKHNRENII